MEFFKFVLIVAAIVTGGIGIFATKKSKETGRPTKWAYILFGLMAISTLGTGLIQQKESDESKQKTEAMQNNLKSIINTASNTSNSLSNLLSQTAAIDTGLMRTDTLQYALALKQEKEIWQSYRPLYSLKEFTISFLLIYFFESDDAISKSYFQRLPDTLLCQIDENSAYYPYPSNKNESNLRQLLHNPNLRFEFTLPGHQTPSLVYTNNRNFELFNYHVFKFNGEKRIQCNINFNNNKIWVADGSIISIIDLIGSTLTLRFDPLSPVGTRVQQILFSLNDMQNIDVGIANNKHRMQLNEKDKILLPGYGKQEKVIAYRKVLTATDLGLPDIWQSIH